MKRILLALGMAVLAAPQAAIADKFSDSFAAARKEMNALGDKVLAGDRNALSELEGIYRLCESDSGCTGSDPRRPRAAAAAANLGWLYWEKEGLGAHNKNYGMYMYAEAALLGAPAGAFKVGECIETSCLPGELEKPYFKDLFAFSRHKPWEGASYDRYSSASEVYRKASAAGLVAASVAAAKAENEILKQDLIGLKFATPDEQAVADHEHRVNIIEAAKQGLQNNPTDAQRSRLESFVAGYEPQLPGLKAEADAARARIQAKKVAASTPSPASAPASQGTNYEADKARARDCVLESAELTGWLKDLNDWKRDLNRWDEEIKQSSIDLQVWGGSSADYSQHNANVDAYNAEGAQYSAEKRSHDRAADAYEARCKGSFNRAAIDEICQGTSADTRFCRSFR